MANSFKQMTKSGVISLEGLVHAEVVEIIDEHKAIASQRSGASA